MLDRRITEYKIGLGMLKDIRAWLDEMPAKQLAEHLIGGVAMSELPFKPYGMMGYYLEPTDFVVTPLPNTMFTRDTTCWIENGVTLNPMFWPARRNETLLTAAIYKFHPDFKSGRVPRLVGRPRRRSPAGDGRGRRRHADGQRRRVLIGMGERTTPQAVGQIVRSMFQHRRRRSWSAPRCRGAGRPCTSIPCSRCCDRDNCTVYPGVVDEITTYTARRGDEEGEIDFRAETGRSSRSRPRRSA